MTFIRLLSQVGGFAAGASTKKVKVVRTSGKGQKTTKIVNMDRIMSGEDSDIKLEPGDIVYVDKLEEAKTAVERGPQTFVTLMGQVGKAGNYPVTANMTLIRLIAQAGGFGPTASVHNIRVVRKTPDGKNKIIVVDAGRIMAGKKDDFKIEDGDLIIIQESIF